MLPTQLQEREQELLHKVATQSTRKDNINGLIEQDDEIVRQILVYLEDVLSYIERQENMQEYADYLLNFHYKFSYSMEHNYLDIDQSYEEEPLTEFFMPLDDQEITQEFITETKIKLRDLQEQLS